MSVGLPLNSGDIVPKQDLEKTPKRGRSPLKEVAVAKKVVGEEQTQKKGKIDKEVSVIKSSAKGRARKIEEAVPLRPAKKKENIPLPDPKRQEVLLALFSKFPSPLTADDLRKACKNPAHAAVLTGELSRLAKPGIDHSSDARGLSPLHYAILLGDVEATRACLKSGAKPDHSDPAALAPPLFMAMHMQNGDIVRLLLQADPELALVKHNGQTPLAYATEIQAEEIKDLLLDSGPLKSVSEMMGLSDEQWKTRDPEILHARMSKFNLECMPMRRGAESSGFLEKHELEAGSDVAVIGDIHGNGLRLDLTLKALQARGFLDENYSVRPGKYLVFLGDYIDRGENNLKVLELLIALKLENKSQVFLIRGNHEDLETFEGNIDAYAGNDAKYHAYMKNPENLSHIGRFFESLPVAVYIGQQAETKSQYIQFCHGLFHLFTDPAPLLESPKKHTSLWVSGATKHSHRIQKLLTEPPKENETPKEKKRREALEKLQELAKKLPGDFKEIYWLDADKTFSIDPDLGRFSIDPETVKAYLRVIGTDSKAVKEIMRGHQGGIWTIRGATQKVVVTTIDPSKDEALQTFMQIKLAEKVKDWQKALVSLPLTKNHQAALQSLSVDDAKAL